jgi:hypothetical protein
LPFQAPALSYRAVSSLTFKLLVSISIFFERIAFFSVAITLFSTFYPLAPSFSPLLWGGRKGLFVENIGVEPMTS